MRRPPLRSLLSACALIVVAQLVATAWRGRRAVTEYGGNCGRTRVCLKDGLGLHWGCRETAGGAVAFADVDSCGDWVATSDCARNQWSAQPCPPLGGGAAVVALEEERRRGPETAASDATRGAVGGPVITYRAGPCPAWMRASADPAARSVLTANLDADADLDCWVLFEDGTIRHVARD